MPRHITILVLATLTCSPAWSDVFIGLDLGIGDLDVDSVSVAPDFELTSISDSATSFHATVGYEFDSGFHVLAGFEDLESIEFLGIGDSIELEALKFGVGYSQAISKRFRAGGTIGIASWDLEARESILFNPGPEATGGLDDTDIFFDLAIEWAISETFRMPLTFNYNDYDFGDSASWRIGVRVHFQ